MANEPSQEALRQEDGKFMGHPGQKNEFRIDRLSQNEKQGLGNGSMGKRVFWANNKDLDLSPQNLTKPEYLA